MIVQPVRERSEISVARRAVCEFAEEQGFERGDIDQLEIVVSEGAANLIRHADGGSVLYAMNGRSTPLSLDIVFIDTGPGISNVERAMKDGFSTAGGLGQGLGAMSRLSDRFDIYSQPEIGTTVTTRFFHYNSASPAGPDGRSAKSDSPEVNGFVVPLDGQKVSGDVWHIVRGANRTRVMMCDGLGHGPAAHEAGTQLAMALEQTADVPIDRVLEAIDGRVSGTRGAAALVVELEQGKYPVITASGAGNIVGQLVSPRKSRHIISFDGTVGRGLRRSNALTYDDVDWQAIVLCTDGLKSRWNLDRYAGLLTRAPLTIAATLWRDFCRGTDDSGIVVIKQ